MQKNEKILKAVMNGEYNKFLSATMAKINCMTIK